MSIEEISFLTPKEQLWESEVLMNFFNLATNERERYEIQAKRLLENNKLEVQTDLGVIKYQVSEGFFTFDISVKPGPLESISSQSPIPETDVQKLETLVEFFARSEAGIIA